MGCRSAMRKVVPRRLGLRCLLSDIFNTSLKEYGTQEFLLRNPHTSGVLWDGSSDFHFEANSLRWRIVDARRNAVTFLPNMLSNERDEYEITVNNHSRSTNGYQRSKDSETSLLATPAGEMPGRSEAQAPLWRYNRRASLHLEMDRNHEESNFVAEGGTEDALKPDETVVAVTEVPRINILPTVMIVGRPNVGKSAMFNRLVHRREALVFDTPEDHVTRDIREGSAKLGGMQFTVLDSAGFEAFGESESILGRTAGISAKVLKRCQIVFFMVDGRAGLHEMDAEVGQWLRKVAPHAKVLLLMNKAEGMYNDDSGRLLSALGEMYRLGFGDPIPVSAEAAEGLGDLWDSLRPLLEEAQIDMKNYDSVQSRQDGGAATMEREVPLQLAIVGRPNVGKSTLLNALLQEERVLTGPEPGLTRDAVSVDFNFEGKRVRLVDTAGWMQRSRLKDGPVALSAMHSRKGIMMSHIVAIVLDGEEIAKTRSSMRHAEASLARWVVQEGRGLVIVVNKMDLLGGKSNAKVREEVIRAVQVEVQTILPQVSGLPVVFTSALAGTRTSEFLQTVFECYKKWNSRFSTAQLNRWLGKVMSRHPRHGSTGGHRAKVQYMTQVKARPPTFVVFVTGSGELLETDLRFLASALREDFDLGGIPIRIVQRSRKK